MKVVIRTVPDDLECLWLFLILIYGSEGVLEVLYDTFGLEGVIRQDI